MVISGGTGTLLGPIAGAAIVVIMKNVVSAYIERWNLVLGVIFILIISFMPEGLVPGSVRLWRTGWQARCARGRTAPALRRAGEPAVMTALAVNALVQIVRRPARHRQRQPRRSSPASGG